MKLDLYQQSGVKKGTVDANDAIFKTEVNTGLMRLAFLRQQANARQANAHTLTRGEVRGGGKKPWKQKGTGRARVGSTRSPLWRHGGIIFGPRNTRNYTQRMPQKMRRAALFSALSSQAADGHIFALDSWKAETPKTKAFAVLMAKLPVQRSLLVVIPAKDAALEKSASNLPNVKVILVNYLNVQDVLHYQTILFLEPALKKAEELFLTAAQA